LVEDEVFLALDMADILEDAGYVVVGPCVRLSEALQMVEDHEIDAALLDVNLDDDQTSAPIANTLRQRNIPFAYVTACHSSDIEDFRADDAIIQKPVSKSALLQQMAKW
jgi:CheY-like chemotaxis protein